LTKKSNSRQRGYAALLGSLLGPRLNEPSTLCHVARQ
jgi:hypothetical protein